MKNLQNHGSDDTFAANTWLLTYNPVRFYWSDYDDAVALTKAGKGYCTVWNCANRHAKVGDRVFMVKLGDGSSQKGIFATGYIISDFWEGENFDSTKDNNIMYVDIVLTKILDYRTDNIITIDELNAKFPEQKWNPQGSGISIKPDAARWLIDNWDNFQETDNIDDSRINADKSANAHVIWKISHGKEETGIPEKYREPFEKRRAAVIHSQTSPKGKSSVSQGQAFTQEIKKGDYFYLCYSNEVVLFGQFTDDKSYPNPELGNGWHERSYRIIKYSEKHDPYKELNKWWTPNNNSSCIKVDDNALFEKLILKPYFDLTLNDLNTFEYTEPYTKKDFLKDVFITEAEYDKLRSLVLRKKNIILQGAPGVGKTFSAKRLAYSIIGGKNKSRICMVQFHQNYSYDDFIMGYRPNESGGFKLQPGVFYNFCERCKKDPDKPYFFIIDEINRGNLSKIFGELLMLIETDKRGEDNKLELVYGGTPFYIPENLHIIGMMNTADRSLAMIDHALRRRFSFYTMDTAFENADKNGFSEYIENIDCRLYHTVAAKIKELNYAICKDSSLGRGFEIGHSYFAPEDISVIDNEWVHNVVEYEIIPLIEEYWFDDDKKAADWKKELYQALGEEYDVR